MYKQNIVDLVRSYIRNTITGFESAFYKVEYTKGVDLRNPQCIWYFLEGHQYYYTKTWNSIVRRDDEYVVKTFDQMQAVSGHSKQCLLNVVAHVCIDVHRKFNRTELNITSLESYLSSVGHQINNILDKIDLKRLFDHECFGPPDSELQVLEPGENFIEMKFSVDA